MSAQPDQPPATPHLVGAASSDADLSAWRDAAVAGALPPPQRERWQVLRAGVVNLWEFDVAEYWFADGRAQFVGQNQSGKSTLMALTTLIMLAGDLDRQLVDTFGQQHKSFRYYVEPTADPDDRRDADGSLSRGWAWVEFGRVTEDGPTFVTALLYAQARRGATFTPQWATCEGRHRVGDGLRLHVDASTRTPADLGGVDGFRAASSAIDYRRRIARLFGFDEVGRLDAVVRMLKVLRTPHLGQKLDPVFVTGQMREALPGIARSEIEQLAEGWDQLERLAADQDSAQHARDAVATFLRSAWNPWADAVLRRRADDLVAATTRVDNVTRRVREATTSLETARTTQEQAHRSLDETRESLSTTETTFEQLLESQAYRDATTATDRVAALRAAAVGKAGHAVTAERARDEASQVVVSRTDAVRQRAGDVQTAEDSLASAVDDASTTAAAAGLPEQSDGWVAEADVARLLAAVGERRTAVDRAEDLLRAAEKARLAADAAADALARAVRQLGERERTAEESAAALEAGLQELSDAVEHWAAALAADAPGVELRAAWVRAVSEQAGSSSPRSVLGGFVREQWLSPLIAPWQERAAVAEQEAGTLLGQAAELDRRIERLRNEPDPEPPAPSYWQRRTRPAPGPAGAPLWRLLDPAHDLAPEVLDHLEAALAASGLLDAWVTPDGAFVADRDGADDVLALTAATPSAGSRVLGDLLRPAAGAGDCIGTVERLLSGVGVAERGNPLHGAVTVSVDGRWRTPTTSGRADPAPHGAELLGASARASARERASAQLEAEAADLRVTAGRLSDEARTLRERVRVRQRDAEAAPGDGGVVQLAFANAAAERERQKAAAARQSAEQRHEQAASAAADANTSLLVFAGDRRLPHTAAELRSVSHALSAAERAAHRLESTSGRLAAARQRADEASALLAEAETEHARRTATAEQLRRDARSAEEAATAAESALGLDEQRLLDRASELRQRRDALRGRVRELEEENLQLQGRVATAEGQLERADGERQAEEAARDLSLAAWWHPVDLGLAAARRLPDAPGRLLTHALAQARAAREQLRPRGWPDAPDAVADKDARVAAAWTKLSGPALQELRGVLESSGGRSAAIGDADETTGFAPVQVLVDSSGDVASPVEAVARLDEQASSLARLHDEKLQEVLVELLSSTFVEHLREQLNGVLDLIRRVNRVLAEHPTGASSTTLRLVRRPAEGQQDAFAVLQTLEKGFIDDEEVQQQVRQFLEQQIREAQERGRADAREWKEHLADLLDYRAWFDITVEFRVGAASWRPLTKEAHAKDSGGGKVVTLLQPLLATLVALYDGSELAPRPLWLDEAFTGVDDANRAMMLKLLVTFDLDFLLAGPAHLVTAAQVPTAAVWYVTRAPAPDPGVDLSLMLWAGRSLTAVPLPQVRLTSAAPGTDADAGPGLFDPEP